MVCLRSKFLICYANARFVLLILLAKFTRLRVHMKGLEKLPSNRQPISSSFAELVLDQFLELLHLTKGFATALQAPQWTESGTMFTGW